MSREAIEREVFFLDTPDGARFAIATFPAGEPKGGLLYLHPFAEEMNKSRRMAALAARTFAAEGWLVLQMDLGGCGDSSGDFGEMTWTTWLDDVSHAWSWLRGRCSGVLGLWTLRAGSLLASDWIAANDERPMLLLWQPVGNGQQHLTQFLRLKAASEMLGAADPGAVLKELRSELAASRPVEVAGYRLDPRLATGLGAGTLRLPQPYPARVAVVELAPEGRDTPSPATAALAGKWREAGTEVDVEVAHGPSFWQTLEIETAPELITSSIRALERIAA